MISPNFAAARAWFGLYGLPGFLGSCFMSVGSLGVGWFPLSANVLRLPIINYLQTSTLGLALTRSFVVVGAALLLQSWLVIGVDIMHEKTVSLRTLYVTMAIWVTPLMLSGPLFSRDVYSYYMQGRLQLDGHNPYESGVSLVPGWFTSGVDPMWADAKTPYGPVFLLIEKGVASLVPSSSLVAAYVFRAISVLGIIAIGWCVPRLARHHGINPVAASWLAVLNPLVIMHLVAGAHNESLMIACSCFAMLCAIEKRFILATVVATIALGIKPVAIVVLPFIAILAARDPSLRSRTISLLKVGAGSALALIVVSWCANVGPLGWLNALSTPGTVRSWLSPMTALGMLSGLVLDLLGFGNQLGNTITLFRLIGAVVLGITLVGLVIRPTGRSATRSVAISFLALVALGPVVQPWYLLWSIPLLAVTGLSRQQMKFVMIGICAFTIHGIANSSATADTFIEFSDGLAMLLAGVTLAIAMFASPRERNLILGDRDLPGLEPNTSAQAIQAESMVLS